MPNDAVRMPVMQRHGAFADPDVELDEMVRLLARVLDVQGAAVSLLDDDRLWLRAGFGMNGSASAEVLTFCRGALLHPGAFVAEDVVDAGATTGPPADGRTVTRFHGGAPLITREGVTIGAVCFFDPRARATSPYQLAMFELIAQQVVNHLTEASTSPPSGPADRMSPDGAGEFPVPGGSEALHMSRLLSSGTTGYIEADVDGVLTFVNGAVARTLGYAPAEMVGRPSREFAHPSHVADNDAAVARLRAGGRQRYEATRVFQHKDGRAVPMRCSVSMLSAATGGASNTAALLLDLSDQVVAGARRVEAEQARRRVLQTATDAYVSMGADGVILEWNAAAEVLFGHPAQDAVGARLVDLMIPPHLVAAHESAIQHLNAGGEPTRASEVLEFPALHREGHVVLIELTPWVDVLADGTRRFHAFCRDIGKRIADRDAVLEANSRLREGQAQLRAAFDASPTADALLDQDGAFVRVNPAMCTFLGASADEVLQARLQDVVYGNDLTLVDAAWAGVARGEEGVYRSEVRFVRGRDDEGGGRDVVWGLASLVPMEPDGGPVRGLLRIENLQSHKELETAHALQVSHDPVSGLPNRSLFVERLRQAMETQEDPLAVAVLVLEVLGLPAVIDRYGFAEGDRMLALVAHRLRNRTPAEVTLAYLQPGRFAAVVPGGAEAATLLAEYYVATFSPVAASPSEGQLAAAVGVASDLSSRAAPFAVRIGRLVQDAETACRSARTDGRGAVMFAAPEMRAAQQRRHDLGALIRDALADDRVDVAYQPVYDLATSSLVGVEALLRVRDPQGRPVAPLDIIPVAEASGLIVDIGRQVLRRATHQVARWGQEHGVFLPVAVNVSAVQLARDTFCADVFAAVEEAGIPPGSLSLELTESVLLEVGSKEVSRLHELSVAGIALAIDDFGTGYASLTYLRDLPATTLKIDRSFVDGLPGDHGDTAIVAGVIGLAKNFGLKCVAEGIETQAQLDYLAGRGVLGQGYLLGRPTAGEAIGALLSQSAPQPPRLPVAAFAHSRDTAGDRRDKAGDARDEVGDVRDRVGDARDSAGDHRDELADQRDRAGDRRDLDADARDELADARDLASSARDYAAAARDAAAERAEGEPGDDAPVADRDLGGTRAARLSAALDREDAEQDRRVGADTRAHASADRRDASEDRAAGAADRLVSQLDRTIALADRGVGADERALAGDDRTLSQGDREASAAERRRPPSQLGQAEQTLG